MNQNASVDIDLPPDEYNGLIYVIDGNDGKTGTPALKAIDPISWTEKASVTLSKNYDAHSVVSLLPDSHNFLYVWSTKREEGATKTSPYTSVSSDVSIYDRNNLTYLTTIPNVRTGFDTTLQSADDEPQAFNMGRGLVVIVSDQKNIENNKSVALVAYDDADSPAAHIIRIDESVTPPTWDTIIKSSDIEGWNIDIESPMPDYDGGLYFEIYSGDVNPNLDSNVRQSRIVHWKKDGTIIFSDSHLSGLHSNGELVISSGKFKGQIVFFQNVESSGGGSADNQITVYLWDGETENAYKEIGGVEDLGREIEKPFTDGGNGLYFMTEHQSGTDEADALYRWNGDDNTNTLIWSSDCEMEVEGEAVPKDGKNGFYFVNVSADLDEELKKGTVKMSLLHCQASDANVVCDLGSFDVPASRFNAKDETGADITPKEALENEYGFLEDVDHEVLFVGGGPLGGKYKLTVLKWTNATWGDLNSGHILRTFTDEELGGSANIAGAVSFTESDDDDDDDDNDNYLGRNSGCDIGLSGVALLAFAGLAVLAGKRRK